MKVKWFNFGGFCFVLFLPTTGQWTSAPHVCTVSLSTLGTAAPALSLRANCWRLIRMHTRTLWAVRTSSSAQVEAQTALTLWMTVHPAPAKAAQSITAPRVDPQAVIPTTLLWEKIRPLKQGRGRDKGTGEWRAC